MPSGRIFRFIGFNGTENGDKVCTLGPKKLIAAVRLAVRVISKKFKVKHPALRVSPGGNQVDGLRPAAIKTINLKILPDGTIYSTSSPRKWIQIQI